MPRLAVWVAHGTFVQESLTEMGELVENRDTYSSKFLMEGLNKLAGAAAFTLAATGADAQEVTRNQTADLTSVSYEMPASVEAALADFKACVEQAALLTDPNMIPDKTVREVAFGALLENCEELQAGALELIDLDAQIAATREARSEAAVTISEENAKQAQIHAEIEAVTASLIAGAKAEIGL